MGGNLGTTRGNFNKESRNSGTRLANHTLHRQRHRGKIQQQAMFQADSFQI
jgi:hypothetical protein